MTEQEMQEKIQKLELELSNARDALATRDNEVRRLKAVVSGGKVYTPVKNMALEIDCENYLSKFKDEDGVRRHAFLAGAQSILDKCQG